MLTIRTITGPQGKLALDDGGADSVPVIFLHSNAGNFTQWREILDLVRPMRRAIAFDIRGHGRSEQPRNGDYSVEGRADDVAAVVDALDLTRFILVGHSGGGVVAAQYAAHHAERVAGVLLVDPVSDGRMFPAAQRDQFMEGLRSAAYAETISEYYGSLAGANAEVRERILWDQGATPPEAVLGTFEALWTYNPEPALVAYHGPRLSLVTPSNDTPAALHHLDPKLPHQVVTATGHWIQLDEPTMLHGLLDKFISSI